MTETLTSAVHGRSQPRPRRQNRRSTGEDLTARPLWVTEQNLIELLAHSRRVGLGEDGADGGQQHLALPLGMRDRRLRRKWTQDRYAHPFSADQALRDPDGTRISRQSSTRCCVGEHRGLIKFLFLRARWWSSESGERLVPTRRAGCGFPVGRRRLHSRWRAVQARSRSECGNSADSTRPMTRFSRAHAFRRGGGHNRPWSSALR